MRIKCQEFVGGMGFTEKPGTRGAETIKVNDGASINDRALAFTCAQVSTIDFASELYVPRDGSAPWGKLDHDLHLYLLHTGFQQA